MIVWHNTHATDGNAGWTVLVEVHTDPEGSGLLALLLAASPDFLAAVCAWYHRRAAFRGGAVCRLEVEPILRIHMQPDEWHMCGMTDGRLYDV